MTSKLLSQLAKHTQAKVNKIAYGHLRSKLNKKGFSEIALYAAVARHCEENSIPTFDMADDMLELIKGCGDNEFYIRLDNTFPFLRRQYNELRHGDLDKGEMKSAEQRGKFLCNSCHLVKKAEEKQGKNHSCKICGAEVAKKNFHKKQEEKAAEKELPPAVDVGKPVVTPKVEPEPSLVVTEQAEIVTQPLVVKGVDIDAMTPRKEPKPEPEEKALFKITQIIGDGDETEFKIVCDTQDLPEVIGILKELQ